CRVRKKRRPGHRTRTRRFRGGLPAWPSGQSPCRSCSPAWRPSPWLPAAAFANEPPTKDEFVDLRDYTFLGTTRSLCPQCRRLVDAKIIVREGRVYFRKRCPEHGVIEDFVCSDVTYYDRNELSQPARAPQAYGTRDDKGCPFDCG